MLRLHSAQRSTCSDRGSPSRCHHDSERGEPVRARAPGPRAWIRAAPRHPRPSCLESSRNRWWQHPEDGEVRRLAAAWGEVTEVNHTGSPHPPPGCPATRRCSHRGGEATAASRGPGPKDRDRTSTDDAIKLSKVLVNGAGAVPLTARSRHAFLGASIGAAHEARTRSRNRRRPDSVRTEACSILRLEANE